MRLLIDMNLSPRWAEVLITHGHDAVHWSSIGDAHAPDTELMRFAASEDRIVVTHDLDFGAILAATGGGRPSVVQVRGDDITPESGAALMTAALDECEAALGAGALVTVDVARIRVTLLPLGGRNG